MYNIFFVQVNYNVVGIIANLASDGHSAWIILPSRDTMLNRVAETIKKWHRHADLNLFQFQFLDPILQFIQVENSPECVHWALWTLSNLIRIFRKYIINISYRFLVEY